MDQLEKQAAKAPPPQPVYVRRIKKKEGTDSVEPNDPIEDSGYPTFAELIKTVKLSKQQVAQLKQQWDQSVEQKI